MKLGIVGLPNVGKSTLFNAITQAGAESAKSRPNDHFGRLFIHFWNIQTHFFSNSIRSAFPIFGGLPL